MNLGAVLNFPMTRCPDCRSTQVRLSRWNQDDPALLRLLFAPYRCIACSRRFFSMSQEVLSLLRWTVLFVVLVALIMGVIYLWNRGGATRPPAALPLASAMNSRGSPQKSASAAPVAPAAANNAQSQFELGVRYLAGQGAPRDPVEALVWLNMAANSGHIKAQYDLGVMYRSGFGVQQDDALAFRWFDLAARQNDADAQHQIALMYKEGVSVPIDMVKAFAWADSAALQGHIGAIALRENLLRVLTPQQVADGQQLAREWTAGAGKAQRAPLPTARR